ncbi:MAG: hypothetical protein MUF85_00890 [Patescibacteria group bacterium]|nr:hypothetical protein [Patescibacteria group bacterium]
MKKSNKSTNKESLLSTKSLTDNLVYIALILLSVTVIVMGYFMIELWENQENTKELLYKTYLLTQQKD